ncbi:MAG: hypothetical protein M1830_009149 [Pleopsidium flavum]|nr:MAG: hypothetical protein M1830_009149 [Pleopsidium flavum]
MPPGNNSSIPYPTFRITPIRAVIVVGWLLLALAPTPLQGKVAVVTGGGRGIGLALARGVVENGGDVVILDASKEPHPDLREMQKEFPGSKVQFYQTDVTSESLLTKTYDAVVQDFGHIECCVTAAGIVLDKPFLSHGWEETIRVQMVNTMGTFFAAQLASRQMVVQKTGGSIVMIASIAAHSAVPSEHLSGYACSKGAVKALSATTCRRAGSFQHSRQCDIAGYIMTDMTLGLGVQYSELLALFESEPPLKRMGDRRDLKAAVVHYLSDASSYTTGSDLLITGGLHLGHI